MGRASAHGVLVGILAIALAGCESMGTAAQSKPLQGSLLGSALGAGAGAIIGNQTRHAGAGTAIGAGLGALGGLLVGNAMAEREWQPQPAAAAPVRTARAWTKFCPVGGETFDQGVVYCPTHGVELRNATH